MKYRRAASALLMAACVIGATAVSATAAERPHSASSDATRTSAAAAQATANAVDTEFVRMMIPHHYQALVMSRLAATRSNDQELLALASRIDVEQDLEIGMMQAWQDWNGLEVTNAEQAYQQVLQNPEMLEQMGMATPDELDDLSAATGTAFDVLYLQLMIEHHEGALDMLLNVIINGSDETLAWWANDMMSTQYLQVLLMEDMLAEKT